MALQGGAPVDRGQELAGRPELQHHVVARVADVHVTPRPALGAVHRDGRRVGELAGARAGDARLAALPVRADLAHRLAVLDSPPPDALEGSFGVELLYPRVAAIRDVDLLAALIGRHPER